MHKENKKQREQHENENSRRQLRLPDCVRFFLGPVLVGSACVGALSYVLLLVCTRSNRVCQPVGIYYSVKKRATTRVSEVYLSFYFWFYCINLSLAAACPIKREKTGADRGDDARNAKSADHACPDEQWNKIIESIFDC